jgi:hypothetical protein
MTSVVLNSLLILLLVAIQGIFVAAELALVSLRESQVRQLAHRGKRGQLVAKLTSNPNLFLSWPKSVSPSPAFLLPPSALTSWQVIWCRSWSDWASAAVSLTHSHWC